MEKLKKLAMIRWEGRPETNRDFEALSHNFLYIWNKETFEEEYTYRQTKAKVIDMWFEGDFVMKDHIYLEDIKNVRRFVKEHEHGCEECDEEEEEFDGSSPPPEDDKIRKTRTIYIT